MLYKNGLFFGAVFYLQSPAERASKVAKIENPSGPALPSDPRLKARPALPSDPRLKANTNPSPPQQNRSNVASDPRVKADTNPSPPQQNLSNVAPPPPRPYTFPIPPPPSIFLSHTQSRPPLSQADRESDYKIVRHIIERQLALPTPRILNGTQLGEMGSARLSTLDPQKELIAYHVLNHFLQRMQSCMSALQILLYGGHGDELGFRRNQMTRAYFALAGRRLLENLAYFINTAHGLELWECPRI